MSLAQHMQHFHLIAGFGFANFAHGKTHVNQHPVASLAVVLLQQAQVHSTPYADHINQRGVGGVGGDFDDLAGYG